VGGPDGLLARGEDATVAADGGGTPAPAGASAGGEAAPSVLIYTRDSTEAYTEEEKKKDQEQLKAEIVKSRPIWSRQQKRIFQRVKSLLLYWEGANYDVLWVVLTTAVGGNNKKLAYHHKMLRNRIERKLGYKGIEFIHVETMEGNGVLHVMWAWKRPPGKNRGVFYIDQQWLSQEWQDIHGARYVFIKRYRGGKPSSARVSRYLVSHYVSNQDALVRVSWSRLRALGFPMAKTWTQFKSIWKRAHSSKVPYREFIAAWERLILMRNLSPRGRHVRDLGKRAP
jgi:hypothetical protein